MSMPLDEAMEVAREAKEQGRLNRHPLALITLAEEVLRLRTLCEKDKDDRPPGIEKHPPSGPP
jgi:hypothetical protein